MNPGNTQKLYEAFPNLYRGRNKTPQDSSMCWGFACDDGWFDLIWNLSQKIEDAAQNQGIDRQSDAWPEAMQVKEKFGRLRFYLSDRQGEFAEILKEAAELSEHTCEQCGLPGALVSSERRVVQTLCERHAEAYLQMEKKAPDKPPI